MTVLEFLDWGHVFLYLSGAVFLFLEGMPLYLERRVNPSIAQAYSWLLLILFWPLVAAYIVIVRLAVDLTGDR